MRCLQDDISGVRRIDPGTSSQFEDRGIMNILLSGGWGYGNLGDDAILTATVKLVRRERPEASITVMTYDCDATRIALRGLDVRIMPSIHRHLSGDLSLRRFRPLRDASSLPASAEATFARRMRSKFQSKIKKHYIRWAERRSRRTYSRLSRSRDAVSPLDEFQSADLFVMSGGAYLSSRWPDSVYAHALELIAAHRSGVRSVLVGQSIGPFKKKAVETVALDAIRLAARVSVRDDASYRDLRSYGIPCHMSPDVALAEVDFDSRKSPEIAIVANNDLRMEAQEQVAQAVVQSCRAADVAAKVLVTRLWEPDVRRARVFCDTLEQAGIPARFLIPDSCATLQREIGASRVVVSPNLHGLVLGWRAGVPCVSLQARGKYLAFMEQTHQAERAFASDRLDAGRLVWAIDDALKTQGDFKLERERISREVAAHFSDVLNA